MLGHGVVDSEHTAFGSRNNGRDNGRVRRRLGREGLAAVTLDPAADVPNHLYWGCIRVSGPLEANNHQGDVKEHFGDQNLIENAFAILPVALHFVSSNAWSSYSGGPYAISAEAIGTWMPEAIPLFQYSCGVQERNNL